MPQSGWSGRSATTGTTYQGNTVGLSSRKETRAQNAAALAERALQAMTSAAAMPAPARMRRIQISEAMASWSR